MTFDVDMDESSARNLANYRLRNLGNATDITVGGALYDAGPAGGGLAPFRAALDALERTELEGRVALVYEDRYALAAFPAFLLLLAGLLMPEARPRPRWAPSGEGEGGAR